MGLASVEESLSVKESISTSVFGDRAFKFTD